MPSETSFRSGDPLICRPEDGYVEEVLFIPATFIARVSAEIQDDKEAGKRVLHYQISKLSSMVPGMQSEAIAGIKMRPEPNTDRFRVAVKYRVGHFVVADFVLRHEQVKFERFGDRFHCLCLQCGKKMTIAADSIVPTPPWFNVHQLVRGCAAEVSDGLYGSPYIYE